MLANIARFLLKIILSLLVGTMFGIWVGFNPASLSAMAYIEQQQNAIRSLNTLLPAMGGVCVLLALFLAALSRNDPRCRILYLIAAVLMVVAGLVTRFGNQPINAIVMTWNAQSPEANWSVLRDQWWQWHVVRCVASIAALVLVAVGILAGKTSPREMAG